jgi:hypothetical protein
MKRIQRMQRTMKRIQRMQRTMKRMKRIVVLIVEDLGIMRQIVMQEPILMAIT